MPAIWEPHGVEPTRRANPGEESGRARPFRGSVPKDAIKTIPITVDELRTRAKEQEQRQRKAYRQLYGTAIC